jgi:hypothetical protein
MSTKYISIPATLALIAGNLLAAGEARSAGVVAETRAPEPVIFTGKVERRGRFVRALAAGLEFHLVPTASGWTLWVGDPARPEQSYTAIATPPFRGINPLYVEGWHFRNADNTAANAPGPKNVNAPQRRRSFKFVLGEADYLSAKKALQIALWPSGHGAGEVAAALERFRREAKADGVLEITGLELGNLEPGEQAWIKRMAFTVTISYPGKPGASPPH